MPLPAPNHSPDTQAAHAAARFGLGARPGTLAAIARDPQGWVTAQIGAPADTAKYFSALPARRAVALNLADFRAAKKARKAGEISPAEAMELKNTLRDIVMAEIEARAHAAVNTALPLQERMLRFWSNHFTTSTKRLASAPFVGFLEREALRPNLFGSFETMLRAVTEHPAMLLYLDNATSIGPNSAMGERRGKGLNENLAREILELHTLGVDGGYTQADVTSFARVITGWTVMPPKISREQAGDFIFNARGHEPGAQTVLGKSYALNDKAQGNAVLHDLALHPATARHLATKIARHFIADDPPKDIVARLAQTYLQSGGNLGALTRAVVQEPAAWQPLSKIRNTEDYLLAVWRGLNLTQLESKWIKTAYDYLGQVPYSADSPAGWGDTASDWAGPDAVMKRINWLEALSHRLPDNDTTDLVGFGQKILGGLFNGATAAAMTRAASRPQALAILLASPEMMRR